MKSPTYIDGIASSEAIDTAGEIVDLKGLDCSSLIGAAFNYEHKSDVPAQIVGKVLEYKKIFSEKDCETDRQKYFWDKCQIPFLYCMGRLFDDKKDSSKEVAALFKDDAENPDEVPMVGFSIEGLKVHKEGSKITRSIARKITITNCPANKTCNAELIPEKKNNNELDDIFKTETYTEISLFKAEPRRLRFTAVDTKPSIPSAPKQSVLSPKPVSSTNIGKTKSGKDVMSHAKVHEYKDFSGQDHQDAAGIHHSLAQQAKDPKMGDFHVQKMKLHLQAARNSERQAGRFSRGKAQNVQNIANEKILGKAMTAGGMNAAPSTLTGGSALQRESIVAQKPKKEKIQQLKILGKSEYDSWELKDQFVKFMKSKMPHLTKTEVDVIGEGLALKKVMNLEKALSKLIKK